jgi:hypothetical protein
MKNITNEIKILIVVLFLSMVNSCQTCNLNTKLAQSNQFNKNLSLSIDSLKSLVNTKHGELVKHIENNAEKVIVIENEIDNQKLKSSEIKKLIKTY